MKKSFQITTVQSVLINGELTFLTRGAVSDQATSCIHFVELQSSSVLKNYAQKLKEQPLPLTQGQISNLMVS